MAISYDDEAGSNRISSLDMILPDNSINSSGSENGILWTIPYNRLTIIGRIRNWSSLTKLEAALFVTTLLALVVCLSFSTLSFVNGTSQEAVFSLLVIVDSLFVLFYLVHGVLIEEPFELLALGLSLVLLSILFIVNYVTDVSQTSREFVVKTVISSLSILFTLATFVIALILSWRYWISGNLVFKTVGGDMKLQRMCRLLLMAQSLLAFDAQWTLLSLILVVQQGFNNITNEQLLLLCAGSVLIAIWLFIGYFAMRLESSYLTWLFVGTSLFQPLYILYLFVVSMVKMFNYSLLSVSMVIAATVCILAHFSLIALLVSVSSNYGKGLSEKVYGTPSEAIPVQESSPGQLEETGEEREPLLVGGDNPSTSSGSRRNYSSFNSRNGVEVEEDIDGIYPADD